MSARYGSGGATGRRIVEDKDSVEKRYRDYNPEHRRQRRVGMGEATLVGGGGTALGFGGRGMYKDTKALRDVTVHSNPNPNAKKVVLRDLKEGKGAVALSRKNGALVLGGGAALAGAAALRRWAEGNRGRAYS